MTGLSEYVRALFDTLSNRTSEDPVQHGIYADTRSRDGLYSITNTQPGTSTYAAGQRPMDHEHATTAPPEDEGPATLDCEDPQTCPTCSPLTSSAD
ncbi:hypothetical protein [Natronorubrum bangense]|uniref:Uncharacterized protein n=2 Tax=Natronorubrum bangense TaxID=61858 RepID=L9WLE8_9EURY|nr:hypothetical protein [Natronorubrum bangense]ELY50294.1 hypothetical protein C494_05793 [Natronorubrum bangense JCM 10635]QCC54263.1 hypothetical protein DV706_07035 [Natronorubrum bangense]